MSEGITLKVKHLNDGNFHAGIRKLSNHANYPTFGTAFMIGKLAKAIAKETGNVQSIYKTTLKHYTDESGEPHPETKAEYDKKMEEFMSTDVVLGEGQFKQINVNAVSKVGLTPAEIVVLEPIFDPSSFPLEAV